MKPLENSSECPRCGGEHKSKPFCTYENGAHCFSCGYTKTYKFDYTPKITKPYSGLSVELPNNVIRNYNDFSLEVKKWLLQFYIDGKLCRKHSILCCGDHSIIYLNKHGGYQQRWINLSNRRIITKGERAPTLFNEQESSILIIVEDYLSAIRAAEHFDSVCLWGTTLTDTFIKNSCKYYDIICICLDNDHAKEINSGQIAAKKLMKKIEYEFRNQKYMRGFTVFNKKCVNVLTQKDLKCYSDTEIRQIIGGAIYDSNK